jgi:hypothetical protein
VPASPRRSYGSFGPFVRSPERENATLRRLRRSADGRSGSLGQAERVIVQANGRIVAREERCVPFAYLKTLWNRRPATAGGRGRFREGAAREAEESPAARRPARGRRRDCGRRRGLWTNQARRQSARRTLGFLVRCVCCARAERNTRTLAGGVRASGSSLRKRSPPVST